MGDIESIQGFAAVGLDVYPCEETEEAAPLFRRLCGGGEYAVIYMTEELAERLEKERKSRKRSLSPPLSPSRGCGGTPASACAA